MPIPFDRFRLLNETEKKIENASYRPLRVKIDEEPEVVVPPGQMAVIPDGIIMEFTFEEIPD